MKSRFYKLESIEITKINGGMCNCLGWQDTGGEIPVNIGLYEYSNDCNDAIAGYNKAYPGSNPVHYVGCFNQTS